MAEDPSEKHPLPEDTRQSVEMVQEATGNTPTVDQNSIEPAGSIQQTVGSNATAIDEKVAADSSENTTDLRKLDSKIKTSEKDGSNPYQHLSPDEAAVLKRQVETPDVKVGMATLYRYATRTDMIIIVIGSITAIAAGAILPVMTIIFGSLSGTFTDFFSGTETHDAFMNQMTDLVLKFVYLGIGMFFAVYISTVAFIYTGEHISGKIREHYLASCLKQNIVGHLSLDTLVVELLK